MGNHFSWSRGCSPSAFAAFGFVRLACRGPPEGPLSPRGGPQRGSPDPVSVEAAEEKLPVKSACKQHLIRQLESRERVLLQAAIEATEGKAGKSSGRRRAIVGHRGGQRQLDGPPEGLDFFMAPQKHFYLLRGPPHHPTASQRASTQVKMPLVYMDEPPLDPWSFKPRGHHKKSGAPGGPPTPVGAPSKKLLKVPPQKPVTASRLRPARMISLSFREKLPSSEGAPQSLRPLKTTVSPPKGQGPPASSAAARQTPSREGGPQQAFSEAPVQEGPQSSSSERRRGAPSAENPRGGAPPSPSPQRASGGQDTPFYKQLGAPSYTRGAPPMPELPADSPLMWRQAGVPLLPKAPTPPSSPREPHAVSVRGPPSELQKGGPSAVSTQASRLKRRQAGGPLLPEAPTPPSSPREPHAASVRGLPSELQEGGPSAASTRASERPQGAPPLLEVARAALPEAPSPMGLGSQGGPKMPAPGCPTAATPGALPGKEPPAELPGAPMDGAMISSKFLGAPKLSVSVSTAANPSDQPGGPPPAPSRPLTPEHPSAASHSRAKSPTPWPAAPLGTPDEGLGPPQTDVGPPETLPGPPAKSSAPSQPSADSSGAAQATLSESQGKPSRPPTPALAAPTTPSSGPPTTPSGASAGPSRTPSGATGPPPAPGVPPATLSPPSTAPSPNPPAKHSGPPPAPSGPPAEPSGPPRASSPTEASGPPTEPSGPPLTPSAPPAKSSVSSPAPSGSAAESTGAPPPPSGPPAEPPGPPSTPLGPSEKPFGPPREPLTPLLEYSGSLPPTSQPPPAPSEPPAKSSGPPPVPLGPPTKFVGQLKAAPKPPTPRSAGSPPKPSRATAKGSGPTATTALGPPTRSPLGPPSAASTPPPTPLRPPAKPSGPGGPPTNASGPQRVPTAPSKKPSGPSSPASAEEARARSLRPAPAFSGPSRKSRGPPTATPEHHPAAPSPSPSCLPSKPSPAFPGPSPACGLGPPMESSRGPPPSALKPSPGAAGPPPKAAAPSALEPEGQTEKKGGPCSSTAASDCEGLLHLSLLSEPKAKEPTVRPTGGSSNSQAGLLMQPGKLPGEPQKGGLEATCKKPQGPPSTAKEEGPAARGPSAAAICQQPQRPQADTSGIPSTQPAQRGLLKGPLKPPAQPAGAPTSSAVLLAPAAAPGEGPSAGPSNARSGGPPPGKERMPLAEEGALTSGLTREQLPAALSPNPPVLSDRGPPLPPPQGLLPRDPEAPAAVQPPRSGSPWESPAEETPSAEARGPEEEGSCCCFASPELGAGGRPLVAAEGCAAVAALHNAALQRSLWRAYQQAVEAAQQRTLQAGRGAPMVSVCRCCPPRGASPPIGGPLEGPHTEGEQSDSLLHLKETCGPPGGEPLELGLEGGPPGAPLVGRLSLPDLRLAVAEQRRRVGAFMQRGPFTTAMQLWEEALRAETARRQGAAEGSPERRGEPPEGAFQRVLEALNLLRSHMQHIHRVNRALLEAGGSRA
ncbi:hypothetical protein Efla_003634 [Eimeria flavescens]